MVWISGGTFRIGSNVFYPEERPVHRVIVDGFWMEAHPVTNAELRRFVDASGYVTVAEREPGERVSLAAFRRGELLTLEVELEPPSAPPLRLTRVTEPMDLQEAVYRNWLRGEG